MKQQFKLYRRNNGRYYAEDSNGMCAVMVRPLGTIVRWKQKDFTEPGR